MMMWPRFLNVALGIWLLMAPAVLGYVDAYAVNNDRMLGLLIIAASVVSLWVPRARLVNVVLGSWLIIAPFVLGYFGGRAVVNDIVVGIACAFFAFVPSRSISRSVNPGAPGGFA
jgi:general stress protein CsbA